MRLGDVLREILRENGIERIFTNLKLESRDVIQQMAVYVANGKADVCLPEKETTLSYTLDGKRVKQPTQAFVGECGKKLFGRYELITRAEKRKFPYILVDCSFFDLHSRKEKSKIRTQIKVTLGVIRDFMWDEKLVIAGKKFEEVNATYCDSPSEFILSEGLKKIILLDPNADKVYRGEKADCFVIGGIVDKSGDKKGLTSKIGENLSMDGVEFESMRIELMGDVIGVPDRINSITEIILLTVLDGVGVESAIRQVQSPLVARWRLRKELPKITERLDGKKVFRFVRKSDFERFKWLNISFSDFLEVCKQMGFLVVDDRIYEEIHKLPYDEHKGRYLLHSE